LRKPGCSPQIRITVSDEHARKGLHEL